MAKKKVGKKVVEKPVIIEEVLPVEEVKEVEKEVKKEVNPKLVLETVLICKDENGNGGTPVEGIVSSDGKSVTTLAGVTFSI